ncbi:MAG: hypothetical protein E7J94_02350 [Clostridium sp.]|uniref:hypothetical protein n=1 Tax=Clostridia TaxID=186801 RepID=UPI00046F8731|nr:MULTISPECIES: hypothetical protein [Clostridia]MDU7706098.1 hypothetical protein [Clostridium sp.]
MVDNTIKDHDGNTTDVYADYIQLYVQEYINTVLNDIDDIKRKQCFAGMIKYVAKKIAPMVNTDDLVMLDNLWDIYTGLCYRYNHVITIERYCILIGIARDTFYSWYKGEYRNDYCPELGATRSDVVKKWDRESESSWQDEATTGNPGPMFVLKARRGWSEQAPAIGQSENRMLQRTADQILSDYQEPKQLPDKDF